MKSRDIKALDVLSLLHASVNAIYAMLDEGEISPKVALEKAQVVTKAFLVRTERWGQNL